MLKKFTASFATLVLALLSFAALSVASIAPASASTTLQICHAVGADKGYEMLPNPNSGDPEKKVVNQTAIVAGKGHAAHEGDIIPPFSYTDNGVTKTYPGMNFDAKGKAIFDNGCKVPDKPVTAVKPVFTPATCSDRDGVLTLADQPAGVTLTYGPVLKAAGLPGTAGVYTVSYVAEDGFAFADGTKTATFNTDVNLPGVGDPLWDAEAGQCALSHTGASIKSEHILYAGILIFAGLLLTTVARRRKA